MKKIVFILVLLLFTAPAWATTVIIDANQVVPGSNEVVITYEVVAPDVNLPRGFGLDITVTDGNITDCIPYMEGECTDSDRGFGIFPGSIVIDDAPPQAVITDYGNPAALAGAIGTPLGSGIDTNCITIELGSLYVDGNAPPSSGVLCTIVITKSCTVRIVGNAARCGEGSEPLGVVMENPDEVPIITYGVYDANYDEGPDDCFDSAHPDYDEWVTVGKPDSWCYKYQCYGDADGMKNGDAFTGYSRVRHADLGILLAGWKVEDYVDEETHPWIAADFDRTLNGDAFTGYSRVRHADLGILLASWKDDSGIDMESPNCGGDIDLTPP